VSYGGLIALRYAALRPRRVRHLVLASALPPDYEADARYNFYRRAPVLLLPVLAMDSARRLSPEIRAALPSLRARARMLPQALRVLAAPVSPLHMRRRMELIGTVDFVEDARHVRAPALAITGEPELDRTVPVELTRRYLNCLPDCEHVVLPRTGHLGTVTRPLEFTSVVASFVTRTDAGRGHARVAV
jgi:pimeloyl-ACP methyl ester carboxylesterase